jgi:hypothetical protein
VWEQDDEVVAGLLQVSFVFALLSLQSEFDEQTIGIWLCEQYELVVPALLHTSCVFALLSLQSEFDEQTITGKIVQIP